MESFPFAWKALTWFLSFRAIVLKRPGYCEKEKVFSWGVFFFFLPSLRIRIEEVSEVRELKNQFSRPGQGGSAG